MIYVLTAISVQLVCIAVLLFLIHSVLTTIGEILIQHWSNDEPEQESEEDQD